MAIDRKHIRFEPDQNTTGWLSYNTKDFQEDLLGLVDQESYGGFAILTNAEPNLKIGDKCLVKVGKLGALEAEIRWKKNLDDKAWRSGYMFVNESE